MKTATMKRVIRISAKIAVAAGFIVVVVLLMLWLMGTFASKVKPGEGATASSRTSGVIKLETVELIQLPMTESSSGRIEAVQESLVAANIMAKVLEANVRADQHVKKGEILFRLDDSDLHARVKQAEAELDQATATRNRSKSDLEVLNNLYQKDAASKRERDNAATALERAEAAAQAARQAIEVAKALLAYATIQSPMDGIVVDKRVKEGDTVSPGQVMVKIYDPTRMQMVAPVRESLIGRLHEGQPVQVEIVELGLRCQGQVSEIVREADPASRSMPVKVTGPCHPQVHSGMFARLLIPLDPQPVLAVSASAIQRVGQLTMVDVAEGETIRRRSVRLGRKLDGGRVEVLSGLHEGEKVVVETGA